MVDSVLDISGSGWGQTVRSCASRTKPSASIKCGEFLSSVKLILFPYAVETFFFSIAGCNYFCLINT